MRISLEVATEGLGDDAFVAASVFAKQEAQLFGLNHAGSAACLPVMVQGVGDVARHPFLIGEAVANGVDQAGDAAETVQATAGEVGDVGKATERHEMVWANAVDGDAAYDDHVAARVFKAFAKRGCRIELVAAKQASLPEFAHTLCRAPHMHALRFDAAGFEQIGNRMFKSLGIERMVSRDADRCRCPAWAGVGTVAMVVTKAVGCRGVAAVNLCGHGYPRRGGSPPHDTRARQV